MAELWLFWNLVVKFTVCYRLYEPSKRVVTNPVRELLFHLAM